MDGGSHQSEASCNKVKAPSTRVSLGLQGTQEISGSTRIRWMDLQLLWWNHGSRSPQALHKVLGRLGGWNGRSSSLKLALMEERE